MIRKEPKMLAHGGRELAEVHVGRSTVTVGGFFSSMNYVFPIVFGLAGAFMLPMFVGDGTPRLTPALIGLFGGGGLGYMMSREMNSKSA